MLKLFRNLGLLCFSVFGLTSCFHSDSSDSLRIPWSVHDTQLKNGLRLLIVADPELPSVSYQTWVQAGSVNDPSGKSGLAHFFEHLYFKNGTDLEREGAELSASTGRDSTVFYSTFAPQLLERMIEFDARRLKELQFDEKDLQIQKAIALEERRIRIQENVEGQATEFLWSLLYRTHPYGNPILGHPHELVQIETGDLKQFKEMFYQPGAILIVIAGPVDPGLTRKWIEKHFRDIPGRPVPQAKIPVEPEPTEQRRLKLNLPGAVGHRLWMGIPTPSAKDPDAYAIDVLCNILFEGRSSRVYSEDVLKNKVFRTITGQSYTPRYPGMLTVSAHLRPGVPIETAENRIEEHIRILAEQGPTREEVSKAVRQLNLDLIAGAQSSSGTAQLLGTLTTLLGGPAKIASVLKNYDTVQPKDVQRIARKLTNRNLRAIVEIHAIPEKGNSE